MIGVTLEYTRTMPLLSGGEIVYRLPNCIEQVRFFVDSKWNSKTLLLEQVEGALPHVVKFILEVRSDAYTSFDEVVQDRSNLSAVIDVILDIANQLDEGKKKP